MKKKLNYLMLAALLAFAGCDPVDPWAVTHTNPLPGLPEMPKQENNSNYVYVTHTAKNGNREMRNYTLCFDKTKYAARWVAYPLHQCYRGGTERYDIRNKGSWPRDPKISAEQATGGGFSGYARGHQLPSADRTCSIEMNDQTFYMSNMTPQSHNFNGGIWLELENRVRGYMCSDTLYVVTGAHWDSGYKKAGKYPVPTHYYKVLLRTRNGRSTVYKAKREDMKCIGFWLSHNASGELKKSHCKSVAEIERLTGFTFFPNVDVDKTACVPAEWGLGN